MDQRVRTVPGRDHAPTPVTNFLPHAAACRGVSRSYIDTHEGLSEISVHSHSHLCCHSCGGMPVSCAIMPSTHTSRARSAIGAWSEPADVTGSISADSTGFHMHNSTRQDFLPCRQATRLKHVLQSSMVCSWPPGNNLMKWADRPTDDLQRKRRRAFQLRIWGPLYHVRQLLQNNSAGAFETCAIPVLQRPTRPTFVARISSLSEARNSSRVSAATAERDLTDAHDGGAVQVAVAVREAIVHDARQQLVCGGVAGRAHQDAGLLC